MKKLERVKGMRRLEMTESKVCTCKDALYVCT